MAEIAAQDGTRIHYEDRGSGRPVIFSHAWPLSADAWEPQLGFFASRGYRAVAHDRRGHGRSGRTPDGNDVDTFADDLAALIEALGLEGAVLVGHGAGGGEAARYVGRHGTPRVAKVALVGAVTPLMLRTQDNPHGTPLEAFDGMRAALAADRPRFFEGLAERFYGADVPRSIRDVFLSRAMACGLESTVDCIGAFSETDFTEDLKKIDVPTMIIHGDDDQVVPIVASALRSSKLIGDSVLRVYEGAPHGLPATHADRLNAELLGFIEE